MGRAKPNPPRSSGGRRTYDARPCEREDVADFGVGFHAQQAVEKLLKSLLNDRHVAYPPIHNLRGLIAIVENSGLVVPAKVHEIHPLQRYAVTPRYDAVDEWPLDRQWTLQVVRHVADWVDSELAKPEATDEGER